MIKELSIDNLFKSILNNVVLIRKILSIIKDISKTIHSIQYFKLQKYNFHRLLIYHPDQLILHGYYREYIDTLNFLLPPNDICYLDFNHNSINNSNENRFKRAIYISKFNQSFLNLLKVKKYDICISLALSNRFYGKLFRAPLIEDFIIAASKDHHLNIIQQIIQYYSNVDNSIIKSIVTQKVMDSALEQENNLEIIDYLFGIAESENLSIEINYQMISKSGNLDVFHYFKDRKHKPTSNTEGAIDVAALKGRLDIVEYLYNVLGLHCTYRAMNNAAHNGHIDILKFLHRIGIEGHYMALEFAGDNGHIDVMEWLLENRTDFPDTSINSHVFSAAARNGHLNVLKKYHQYMIYEDDFLYEEYGVVTQFPLDAAAVNGHMEIVSYCIEVGMTRNRHALQLAVENNQIEVAKYLIEVAPSIMGPNSVTFDLNDIAIAVLRGHIDMVKYIYSIPKYRKKLFYTPITRYDEEYIMNKSFKSLDMVRWFHTIYSNDNDDDDDKAADRNYCTTRLMNSASFNNQIDVVKWLHENRTEGCSSRAMDMASESGYLEIVKWLHINRTEGCTTKAIDYKSSFEVVQFLLENRTEGFTSIALERAISFGNLDTLLLLLDKSTNLTSNTNEVKHDFKVLISAAEEVQLKYPYIFHFLLNYIK